MQAPLPEPEPRSAHRADRTQPRPPVHTPMREVREELGGASGGGGGNSLEPRPLRPTARGAWLAEGTEPGS